MSRISLPWVTFETIFLSQPGLYNMRCVICDGAVHEALQYMRLYGVSALLNFLLWACLLCLFSLLDLHVSALIFLSVYMSEKSEAHVKVRPSRWFI